MTIDRFSIAKLRLGQDQDPIVVYPTSHNGELTADANRLGIIYLETIQTDGLNQVGSLVQANIYGALKPLNKNKVSALTGKKQYVDAVNTLADQIASNELDTESLDFPVYVGGYPLVIFQRDENRVVNYNCPTLVSLGEQYSTDSTTPLNIHYLGGLEVMTYQDCLELGESVAKNIALKDKTLGNLLSLRNSQNGKSKLKGINLIRTK
ncbi:MAG: hypothetical protein WC979_07345 [Candidatus Pacearchaeota archaeon]|jgi:hypothetical protein